MKRAALILATLALLALPAGAEARAHHHHAKHHALRHHRAHKAQLIRCEGPVGGPEEPVWAEWRADMAAAGFSSEETEELEDCY
jgi:hypothetical protein